MRKKPERLRRRRTLLLIGEKIGWQLLIGLLRPNIGEFQTPIEIYGNNAQLQVSSHRELGVSLECGLNLNA